MKFSVILLLAGLYQSKGWAVLVCTGTAANKPVLMEADILDQSTAIVQIKLAQEIVYNEVVVPKGVWKTRSPAQAFID